MKSIKLILPLLILVLLTFTSCTSEKSSDLVPNTELKHDNLDLENPLLDMSLWNQSDVTSRMKFYPNEFTLTDVDAHYKEIVESNPNHAGLENFRHSAIKMLVNQYNLNESKNPELLKFYLNELEKCNYSKFPRGEYMLIKSLRSLVDDSEIIPYIDRAKSRVDEGILTINNNLNEMQSHPEVDSEVIKKIKKEVEFLKRIKEEYESGMNN